MSDSPQNSDPHEAESFTFKAETQQLLNILIHSLYKDREVFLRELLSNASDALNRLSFEMLTERQIFDSGVDLDIHIRVDKDNRLLTITDTGLGMTRDEIVENLGTIAQSGARKFIEATRNKNADFTQVIGQFGVGFYSVFMVAEWAKVTSRSYRPHAKAVSWYATGDDHYQISPAEKNERGTEIQIKVKEDAVEFLEENRIRQIIQKHSDYINFPIYLGDNKEPVNKQSSLWRTAKKEITEEQYNQFYQQTTLDYEEPLLHIHMITDVPVQLYALLYISHSAERGMFSLRREDGLKLYSRNILIDEYNKDLLPEYLSFVQGVVDSEDLPLNVSRETIQSTGLMAKLKKIITGQVIRELENLANKNPEKYLEFWQEYGSYLKQGVAKGAAEDEPLSSLLRFRSTQFPEGWVSLDDYVSRMKPDQKQVYYLIGEDPKSILLSPHLDSFQTQGVEVILLTEPMDSFMLLGLHKYKEFELTNVTQAELPEADETKPDEEKVSEEDFLSITDQFKQVLKDRVLDVRSSSRLSHSVARLVDPEGTPAPELQRVYKYLGKEIESPKKILELNPAHALIKNLTKLNPNSPLGNLIIEQIFETALLVEGLHPDPTSMAPRIEQIMEQALSNSIGKQMDSEVQKEES